MSVRDGAYSTFETNKVVECLNPIPNLQVRFSLWIFNRLFSGFVANCEIDFKFHISVLLVDAYLSTSNYIKLNFLLDLWSKTQNPKHSRNT